MEQTKSNISEEQILRRAGIRITAVRLLILRTINREFSGTFNLADLEESLPTVDKSTLFRTLNLMTENHILDAIDDGSGSQKYCLAHFDDNQLKIKHVHFTCHICHQTFCLTDILLPEVTLPEGFQVEDAEYVAKGICPDCAKKHA
ncbi:MAG: transcriptional repressor [Bacteroidales bacterium]|nr:transcriptional repressor [Bacteroidales bacterium]